MSASLLAGALHPAVGLAASLPKVALSVTPGGIAGPGLRSLDHCGSDKPATPVTPAIEVDLGDPKPLELEAISRALPELPAGRAALLHLRLRATLPAAGAIESAALDTRVAQVVAALGLDRAPIEGVLLEIAATPGDLAALQFSLARLVLLLKAAQPSLRTAAVVFPPGLLRQQAAIARRLSAYADMIGVGFGADWRREAEWARAELGKPVVLVAGPDGVSGEWGFAEAYLGAVAETGDALVDTLWATSATPEQAIALCRAAEVLSGSVGAGFASVPLDQAPATLRADGEPIVASAFIDSGSTSSAFLVRTGGSSTAPRRLTVTAGREGALAVTCLNALDGRALESRVTGSAAPKTRSQEECVSDTPYTLVSVSRESSDQRVYNWVSVTGRGTLRVEEIVARWQQYRAAQQRELENYTADCLLSLHFEPTTLGSGFDVSLELQQFVDRSGQRDWVQRGFLVNGVRFHDASGFPLPSLEPEKVLAQPLELALQEKYRYELLGTETVDGVLSYVVGVKPEKPGEMLFTGKVWIDGATYRQVRMELQQSGGRSSILSQVETQDYQLVPAADGRKFNLLRAITARQLASAAGRSLLVERKYSFTGYGVNSAGFEKARAEAQASDLRMYRDTAEGMRVLRREGGTRVVEPLTRQVRSLVGGLIYEGTFDFPIPLAGFSLVDYDYHHTGAELSLFFAGPILATNLTKRAGHGFRFGMDLALSAIPQNNRVFLGDVELSGQGVWVWEETVGALASWQARPWLSLGASTYFSLDAFHPSGDVAPGFRASGTGFMSQSQAELKLTRDGYTLAGTLLTGHRFSWPVIGLDNDAQAAPQKAFLKYSGEASKQFYFGKFTKAGLSASYYGGQQLDRFSRYQPSFLSRPRIHGIPSGTDTFDEVGVSGAQLGFNAFDVVYVEGMYNRAWGRNLAESNRFRTFDGLEMDLGTVGPWRTFIKGTMAYALSGNLERYNSRWSVYLLVFRPLGR